MSASVKSELSREEDQGQRRWLLHTVPALQTQGPEFDYPEPMLKPNQTEQGGSVFL